MWAMKKLMSKLSAVFLMLAVTACAETASVGKKEGATGPLFSADRIEADVIFLADDTLNGRDTGSEGYRIAANYVAAEFRRLGLKPAGDNSSFFQEVPFRTGLLKRDAAKMTIQIGGKSAELALGDDYFVSGGARQAAGKASGELVFAGYGIHAPDLGHDDLSGLDLDGKIVVLFYGAPKSFQSEIRAHHGSSTTKKKELTRRGAVGTIYISTPSREKRRPFARLKNYLDMKDFDWVPDSEVVPEQSGTSVSAAVSPDVAARLFEGAARSFEDVAAEAEEGRPVGFPLKASAAIERDSIQSDIFHSPNVLAVLEGSDPALKSEYVLMSAHLDHIGVSEHAKGDDKINNGALDNASGVAIMLEVARAYARSGTRPRRSILFAAVTAEEKGLLGAGYFAAYPTVPLQSIVGNVNVDMPILLYDFSDIVAFGGDRSSLGDVTRKAAGKIGVALSPDPMPQEGIFTRSDHYRFVQKGIPSVFLVTGWGPSLDGQDGGRVFMEFLGKTYHKPHDDLSQPINFAAGAKFAHINWLIVNDIANADERPAWNKGDFFGRVFAGAE